MKTRASFTVTHSLTPPTAGAPEGGIVPNCNPSDVHPQLNTVSSPHGVQSFGVCNLDGRKEREKMMLKKDEKTAVVYISMKACRV